MYLKVKRIFDFIIALVGLIVLLPIFIILCIIIKLDSRGPIFFIQERVGVHKKAFNIIKFRTMKIDAPKNMPTHLLKEPDQYITRVGKLLRKSSLDEIPQIINILKGEMSIVGPRPALFSQVDLLEERAKYGANDIPVGLTGWAQINGRDELPIDVKARLDGEYVNKMSFVFDVKCFFGTIVSVVKKEGVVEGLSEVAFEHQSKTNNNVLLDDMANINMGLEYKDKEVANKGVVASAKGESERQHKVVANTQIRGEQLVQ